MDEILNNCERTYQTIKITTLAETESRKISEDGSLVRNAMDTYLKRHKLDLTLLPNKKIKLSDLTQTASNSTTYICLNNSHFKPAADPEKDTTLNNQVDELLYELPVDKKGLDGTESEVALNSEDEENELNTTDEFTQVNVENIVVHELGKRSRKKREPSLKLQQKLSNDDLELIVNCVRNRSANISIADVKKDNYVDKILKVQLLDPSNRLSNGKNEALLKKSMFSKELNTLFDSFVNALCGQKHLVDENGNTKPTLTCLVVECGYKSFSEAEIMRHIKRHLAQDGYTCSTCSHQFASMTNLQRHLRIHAGNVGKEMKCPECDYKASTITHVKRHMAHKHLERALPCPHCSFMGATNAELKIHMARKHLELTGKNPLFLPKYLRKDYQCSLCKEQYNDFKEYQAHMYEHTSSSNRFQCTECPYNCKNFSKLKRHMLYHTGARNYSCELCGNKFFQMEHLKRHMQSIHDVVAQPSSTSSQHTSNNTKQKIKGGNKSKQKNTSNPKKPIYDGLVRQGPVVTTIANDHLSTNYTSQNQCFRITSRCMYKCQHCEFSTVKLYNLNEHVLNKHARHLNLNNQINTDSFLSDELEMNEYDEDNNTSSDFEFDETDHVFNETSLNEDSITHYLQCSFCSYRTDKKLNLKRHLQNNHSSQAPAPILLSNDPVITNSNTKFQCSTCRAYVTNVNEYIKHMNGKHAIQVYIMDLNGEASIQEQIHHKGKAEIMSTSQSPYFNERILNPQITNQQSPNPNLNQRQQLRNFINSSTNLQSRQQKQQHTTVRINPLLFKRQNVQFQQQPTISSKTEHLQICSLNIPHNTMNEFPHNTDINIEHHHQLFNPHQANNTNNQNNLVMDFTKANHDLDFNDVSINETPNHLGLIVNEFQ